MTDAEKLFTLADWFDIQDDKKKLPIEEREVQRDLRRMAHRFIQLDGGV